MNIITEGWHERNRVVMERYRDPAAPEAAASVAVLRYYLQRCLNELNHRAQQGEADSAEMILATAHEVNEMLWDAVEKQPEMFPAIVAKKWAFPCNFPILRKHQDKMLEIMKKIKVGSAYNAAARKQFDTNIIANSVVLEMVDKIQRQKRKIVSELAIPALLQIRIKGKPPKKINVTTWDSMIKDLSEHPSDDPKKWADVIWKTLLMFCNGHPEKHPNLRQLGTNRKDHSYELGQQKKVTDKTRDANVRDGIKKSILSAVKRIFKQSR